MGLKIKQGKTRFVFETEDEREILEEARNYFGSRRLLLNEGLGYHCEESAPTYFHRIKSGKDRRGYRTSISVENWEKIQEYASRFRKGERYEG